MPTGTVKWFSDEKGSRLHHPRRRGQGSLRAPHGISGEGFKSLTEGAKVNFDAESGDKGPKAVNVTQS